MRESDSDVKNKIQVVDQQLLMSRIPNGCIMRKKLLHQNLIVLTGIQMWRILYLGNLCIRYFYLFSLLLYYLYQTDSVT